MPPGTEYYVHVNMKQIKKKSLKIYNAAFELNAESGIEKHIQLRLTTKTERVFY